LDIASLQALLNINFPLTSVIKFSSLANFIVAFVIGLIAMVPALAFLSYVFSVATLIPSLAIMVRRLRDAGYKWYNVFWAFLPIAGIIILIVLLVKPTK
jgi:uncharacterized membrane protein YhaH (DUF805 family)